MEKKNMSHRNRWIVLLMIMMAALVLTACNRAAATEGKSEPVKVEPIEGTEFNQVILTDKAAQRLGIELDSIREEDIDGEQLTVMPYAALIYGLSGETWAYTSSDGLSFRREPITIDYIVGNTVVLIEGPSVGTDVAVVGVAELYGADTGIGK
jgi:ABC-type oligopeptide transport system substrate-binding subunit